MAGRREKVKLFVGNLTPGIESKKLKALFSQHGDVVELDVIKNFAFVHMACDADADAVVRNLDNYSLDGRPIHIEKSTSRLRKAPGMSAVCYSCGALDHKTPQCPRDPAKGGDGRRASPLGNGSNRNNPYPPPGGGGRREGSAGFGRGPSYGAMGPPPQSAGQAPNGFGPPQAGYQGGAPPMGAGYGQAGAAYGAPQASYPAPYAAPPPATNIPPPAGAYVDGGDPDPLIPHPSERDLEPLWKEYSESRERYFYFREKLSKEMRARSALSAAAQPAGAAYGAVGSGYSSAYGGSAYGSSYGAPAAGSAYAAPPPTAADYGQPSAAVAYGQPAAAAGSYGSSYGAGSSYAAQSFPTATPPSQGFGGWSSGGGSGWSGQQAPATGAPRLF